MINHPSCEQLVQLVREHLETSVGASITDVPTKTVLAMIDSILANVASRCGHEVAWMHEEVAVVLAEADDYVDNGRPGAQLVAEALAVLRELDSSSLHFDDVQRRYDAAGEVLSRLLENCRTAGETVRQRVEHLLEQRLHRELHIRGSFELAGRS